MNNLNCTESKSSPRKPLRVLSLDGGGMRGIYSATYLSKLTENFSKVHNSEQIDLGSKFDLIVGTSTGAIVGCALATGVPMNDVVSLYRKHGKKIFQLPMPTTNLKIIADLVGRKRALKAGEKTLREALTETLGTTTLGEVYRDRQIAMAIPTVEMGRHRAWVFKTAHLSGSMRRDDDYSLVDICLATSAAPLYRSLACIPVPNSEIPGAQHVFADGGLWANNPVLVALVDALGMASEGQEIQIFCLGTCSRPSGEEVSRSDVHRGLLEWKFGADAASLSLDAQEMAYHYIAKMLMPHLKNPCHIVRFPFDNVPASMMPYLDLDNTTEGSMNALVRQAHSDADFTNSKCARNDDPGGRLISSLFTPE